MVEVEVIFRLTLSNHPYCKKKTGDCVTKKNEDKLLAALQENVDFCLYSVDDCLFLFILSSIIYSTFQIYKTFLFSFFSALLHLSHQTTKCTYGTDVVNFLSLSSQAIHAPLTVWAGTRPSRASWLLPQTTALCASGVRLHFLTRRRRMDSTVFAVFTAAVILSSFCFCVLLCLQSWLVLYQHNRSLV